MSITLNTILRRVENLPGIVYNEENKVVPFAEDHNSLVDAVEELASKARGEGETGFTKTAAGRPSAWTVIDAGVNYTVGMSWIRVLGGNSELILEVSEVDANGGVVSVVVLDNTRTSGYITGETYQTTDDYPNGGTGCTIRIDETIFSQYKINLNTDNIENDVWIKMPNTGNQTNPAELIEKSAVMDLFTTLVLSRPIKYEIVNKGTGYDPTTYDGNGNITQSGTEIAVDGGNPLIVLRVLTVDANGGVLTAEVTSPDGYYYDDGFVNTTSVVGSGNGSGCTVKIYTFNSLYKFL